MVLLLKVFPIFTDDGSDGCMDLEENLVGHSLSWEDVRNPKSQENRYSAKLWMPEGPTESDLITLASYASDYL